MHQLAEQLEHPFIVLLVHQWAEQLEHPLVAHLVYQLVAPLVN